MHVGIVLINIGSSIARQPRREEYTHKLCTKHLVNCSLLGDAMSAKHYINASNFPPVGK